LQDVESLLDGVAKEVNGSLAPVYSNAHIISNGFPCVDFSDQLSYDNLVANACNIRDGKGKSGSVFKHSNGYAGRSSTPFVFEENVPLELGRKYVVSVYTSRARL
jgi:hypothetical protein